MASLTAGRPGMAARLARLFHTARHLKLSQIFYYVKRRKFSSSSVASPTRRIDTQPLAFTDPLPISGVVKGAATFNFLNIERNFEGGLDWTGSGLPRLWGYNLHYFDFLRQPDIDLQTKVLWVRSWIEQNPQGSEPAWEPFTTSLRIVNWVFFFADHHDLFDGAIRKSLYLQSLWLERNDERHILANHYFENLKALLFSGALFKGKDAARWRTRAAKKLLTELSEQALTDGGHYERSPQYHGLMLENLLDLYNLQKAYPEPMEPEFRGTLLACCKNSLNWLEAIVFPDGEIPLFNDSAFGVAPGLTDLQSYAASLFDYIPKELSDRRTIVLPESGIYGLSCSQDMILMDCGDVGPRYQPGHTHADFLSYELMLSGSRVVVDSGVCEYEPGPRRHALRQTHAHNTVSVNGLDQSEVWGEFRVARRAKKLSASVIGNPCTDTKVTLAGGYQGFFEGLLLDRPLFRHERQMDVKLDKGCINCVHIIDRIASLTKTGSQIVTVESFIHIHPDFEPVFADQLPQPVETHSESKILLLRDQVVAASISYSSDFGAQIIDSIYCPEFGKAVANKKIVLSPVEIGPNANELEISYTIWASVN